MHSFSDRHHHHHPTLYLIYLLSSAMRLHWLVGCVIIIPIVSIITAYIISISLHLVPEDRLIPWISATIDYPPASTIGSLGLSLTAFFIVLFAFVKHRFNRLLIAVSSDDKKALERRNKILLYVGFLFGFCLNGVACVQFHVSRVAHLSFAGTMFFSGAVYVLAITHLDFVIKAHTRRVRIVRALCGLLASISCILCFILSFFLNTSGRYFILSFAAASEILIAVSYFLFFATYYSELAIVHVHFDVEWYELSTPLLSSSPTVNTRGENTTRR
eukprot:TRINITY_DN2476_c0_g1_i5.p1 TRINITY_DN2476_c0_g1~~TRINITY_DN2476_c0_g1_i5.p1  ORF type:complete len:273 (-),score=34.00 TRINITY_DN2476_c0_g1_i5:49-867(-)